jgi:hypothetical protein
MALTGLRTRTRITCRHSRQNGPVAPGPCPASRPTTSTIRPAGGPALQGRNFPYGRFRISPSRIEPEPVNAIGLPAGISGASPIDRAGQEANGVNWFGAGCAWDGVGFWLSGRQPWSARQSAPLVRRLQPARQTRVRAERERRRVSSAAQAYSAASGERALHSDAHDATRQFQSKLKPAGGPQTACTQFGVGAGGSPSCARRRLGSVGTSAARSSRSTPELRPSQAGNPLTPLAGRPALQGRTEAGGPGPNWPTTDSRPVLTGS